MALEARSVAVPTTGRHGRVPPRDPLYTKSVARQQCVLAVAARIGAVVSGFFGTAVYLATPRLYRLGELVAPVTFVGMAYLLISVVSLRVGTGSGMQFYYLVGAAIIVLVLAWSTSSWQRR